MKRLKIAGESLSMNILIEGMSRQLGGMEAFIMSVYRGLDRELSHGFYRL